MKELHKLIEIEAKRLLLLTMTPQQVGELRAYRSVQEMIKNLERQRWSTLI